VDLDEILYRGDDIEDDLDYILFNPTASTISKWRTFKVLRWAQLLNQLVDLDEIVYGGDVEDDIGSILLNLIASTIQKRWTSKVVQILK
jgi:hypothetical protein